MGAGLLNNRRVTTHWMFSELLATTYPLIQVDSRLLFARDGNIYSSGGITALRAGSPRESIWPLPYLKKILARKLLSPSPGRWSSFPGAPGGSPNSAPI
jgi:hypothetical protein